MAENFVHDPVACAQRAIRTYDGLAGQYPADSEKNKLYRRVAALWRRELPPEQRPQRPRSD